jgi:hypothetical protein
MGIRASSGGQLNGGNTGGGGGGLTVEQVQDIVSESVTAGTEVEGLLLTSVYDDALGKIRLNLATQGAPITNVVPASIVIKNAGISVGSAKEFNFSGTGIQSITLTDDIANISVEGGGGEGISGINISQNGGAESQVTALNFVGATVTVGEDGATISIDGGSSSVGSVNGQTGTVILSTDEVNEGTTNQYFTNNRFDQRFNVKTTDNLTEGSGNFYFTNARFDQRLATKTADNIAEGSSNFYFTNSRFDSRLSTKTTDNVAEGSTNKYYTDARARAAFSAGTGISISGGVVSVNAIPNTGLQNSSVTIAGKTVALGGSATIAVGDLSNVDLVTDAPDLGQALVWNGTKWVPGAPTASGTVTNVNGQDGIVILTTSEINEGSNLYYTTARANTDFDTRLATKSTTNLVEGTNLYYTDARANTAFDTRLATKSTTNLVEGTNLYYTDTRVDARVATTNLSALADVTSDAPSVNQVLKWNGTAWAPAYDLAGAGIFSVTAQIDYDPSGNLTAVSVLNGTATATITNATSAACEVTFEFTGATNPPLTTVVYGYQRVTNVYVQRAVDANFTKRVIAGGGTSGAPTAFTSFNSGTNTMALSLTKALTGASASAGQTTHCVVQFTLV